MRSTILRGLLVTSVIAGCASGRQVMRQEASRALDGAADSVRMGAVFRLEADEFDQPVTASLSTGGDSTVAPPPPPAPTHQHGSKKPMRSPLRSVSSRSGSANPGRQPATRIIFACPMHPDVTDTTDSICPKCGMTLEPRQEKP